MKKLMNLFSALVLLALTVSCQKDVEVNVYTDKPIPNILPVDKDGNHYGYEKPFIIRPVDVGAPKGHQVYSVPVWCRYEGSTVDVSYKNFDVEFYDTRIVLTTDVPMKEIVVGVLYDYYITVNHIRGYESYIRVKLNEVPLYNRDYYKYTFNVIDLIKDEGMDQWGRPTITTYPISYEYRDDRARSFSSSYGMFFYRNVGNNAFEFIEIPRNYLSNNF